MLRIWATREIARAFVVDVVMCEGEVLELSDFSRVREAGDPFGGDMVGVEFESLQLFERCAIGEPLQKDIASVETIEFEL